MAIFRRNTTQRFLVAITVIVNILLCASLSLAQQKKLTGTTADFARAYPWVMVLIIGLLGSLVIFLLKERDSGIKEKLQEASLKFDKAQTSLDNATRKIDATINTLFEHDRDIEKRLAEAEKAQQKLETTCKLNRELCHARAGIECLDRRDGTDRRGE